MFEWWAGLPWVLPNRRGRGLPARLDRALAVLGRFWPWGWAVGLDLARCSRSRPAWRRRGITTSDPRGRACVACPAGVSRRDRTVNAARSPAMFPRITLFVVGSGAVIGPTGCDRTAHRADPRPPQVEEFASADGSEPIPFPMPVPPPPPPLPTDRAPAPPEPERNRPAELTENRFDSWTIGHTADLADLAPSGESRPGVSHPNGRYGPADTAVRPPTCPRYWRTPNPGSNRSRTSPPDW